MTRRLIITSLAVVLAIGSSATAGASTESIDVGRTEYNLGDTAFTMPGFLGPNELQAVVHYPKDRGRIARPLVLQLHGMWWTCVDVAKHEPTMDWPCPAGQQVLPSFRGYDYMGQALARQGFVVVSIGANGINSANAGGAYTDRAHLINKHLRMWQQVSTTGGGELAGKLGWDFRGRVDLSSVGIMGHSRGGMTAMLHSSQEWQATWPAGVRVKAVLGTGAVYNYAEPTEVTTVPFGILDGGCDMIRGGQYFDDVQGRNRQPIHHFVVHGANHSYLNTQWSPGSGQAGAEDDAFHDGLPAGTCTNSKPGAPPEKQLSEAQERLVATAYAAAFFQRYLKGQAAFDPILSGQTHPMARITPVDVRYAPAV